MDIAIIGTGSVGGALATALAKAGHQITLGVRNLDDFKGKKLLKNPNTKVTSIKVAIGQSDVIIVATPAAISIALIKSFGDTTGKIIIDTMNIIKGNGPEGFSNTTDAILANTETKDVVKCFNTTGYNNMENPIYNGVALDAFVAGDSEKGKKEAQQLAKDIGFAECYDIGGNDKFDAMEQFAYFWINLALFQDLGREIGFKLLKR